MNGVKLTGDWSRLENSLHRMTRLNFGKIHKLIGEQMVNSTRERFKEGVAPDGSRWRKSVRAGMQGGQTLVDTRDLEKSITYQAYPDRVDVGTNKLYAPVHQQGKTIYSKRGRYLKFRVGKQFVTRKRVIIPKRPFIGISKEDREEVRNIINDAIGEALR